MTSPSETDDRPRIDDLDRRILGLLKGDARLSSRAIGRTLGVAAGTVGQRIARLEQTGVIRGYAADIDEAHLGRRLRVVVGLQIAQGSALEQILDELRAFPEVEEVLVVTGQWDIIVIGRVSDPDHLNDMLTNGLWQSPSFRHSETMIVINSR